MQKGNYTGYQLVVAIKVQIGYKKYQNIIQKMHFFGSCKTSQSFSYIIK